MEDKEEQNRPPPPWVWAALVAFALVAITTGAIVGMVSTGGSSAASASSGANEAGTTSGGSPTTQVVPPTVSVPLLTDTGGVPSEGGTTETTAPDGLTSWPAGKSGYTIILASVSESQGEAVADATAEQAEGAGLQQVGVLFSSDYSSLRPGFWVVFAGIYDTLEQAQAGLPQAQAAGFAGAYPRTVHP